MQIRLIVFFYFYKERCYDMYDVMSRFPHPCYVTPQARSKAGLLYNLITINTIKHHNMVSEVKG